MAENRGRMPRPTPVAELLAAVFHGTPAERRLREGAIWQVWESTVGKKIAERARPVSIRDGLLTVAVSSAPWMQQLTFLKRDIIHKLNAAVNEPLVRDIHLKAGLPDAPAQADSSAHPPRKRPLTAREKSQVAEEIGAVSDPELREAFARLMSEHLSHSR